MTSHDTPHPIYGDTAQEVADRLNDALLPHPFDMPDPTADELREIADNLTDACDATLSIDYLLASVLTETLVRLRRVADRIDGTR